MCICGRPNVGKSSLLNALLGEDRVIVTPVPGTTRDVIEESISLDGLPAVLWDTAGIRESDDQIERIGVDRSRQHVSKADAVLIVLDGRALHHAELTCGIPSKKSRRVTNRIAAAKDAGDITRLAGPSSGDNIGKAGEDSSLKKSLRDIHRL